MKKTVKENSKKVKNDDGTKKESDTKNNSNKNKDEPSSVPENNTMSGDIYIVTTLEYRDNNEVEAITVGAFTSWDDAIVNARIAFDNSENGEHQDTGHYLCYDVTDELDPAVGGTAFSMDTCTDIYSEVQISTVSLNKAIERTAYFEPAELEIVKKRKLNSK